MKRTLLLVSLITSFYFFSGCTKDEDEPSEHVYPIAGLWIGTYQITGQAIKPLYYSFNLKADSTINIQSLGGDGNTYYGIGTWSLSGGSFTAKTVTSNLSQTGVVQNITALYNSADGSLTSGVVTNEGNSFTATFSLNRVN